MDPNMNRPAMDAETMGARPIGKEQARKFLQILMKYKSGKVRTEQRIVASENWWKMRNTQEEQKDTEIGKDGGFRSVSGWLHNVIVSKHADAMEAYPEPNILPREEGDRAEAAMLGSIIPCVLEQNHFEKTYSDVMWQKMKTGTGVYKIIWDKHKLGGLGDIGIEKVNLLNVYWEPGVADIQRSRYFFHTELCDKEVLQQMYPEQLKDGLKSQSLVSTRFLYDDTMDTSEKATVIEVYYHKYVQGRQTLQYCKFVEEIVLYATENEPEMAERGLYDHGKYPYVFDAMFPIEGSPCGYGFVDLCKNPQTEIDLVKTAFVKNAMVGATPRYFSRSDGQVNEQEFLDLNNPIVHINGNLDENSLRRIDHTSLDGNYLSLLDRTIQELRETSGNTEASTGATPSGVTAASAIAALQEASGKGSRDSTLSAYRCYSEIIELCIELIRQFYNLPRKFRITGEYGNQRFVSYTNQGLQPQQQGMAFGVDMGYRLPVFDIKVTAQKRNVYTKVSQNELALQFYNMGFFNPQRTNEAVMCLSIMDFDGKDGILQKVAQNGTMYQQLVQYMQLALMLAQEARPDMVEGLSQNIMQVMGGGTAAATAVNAAMPESDNIAGLKREEHGLVQKARSRSNAASQPDGGEVIKERDT